MTKNQKRDIATSVTTLVFIVIGTTGIMMYFHILDKYTKEMHEILGLVFVGAVFLDVFVNFNSMKQYFKKKTFLTISILTLLTVGIFAANSPKGDNPKRLIIESVLTSNIEKSFLLFVDDIDFAKIKLEKAGIKVAEEKTIDEIAEKNNLSPFKIIDILTNK
ncbi:hypothetical protein ALC152_02230 [Arcobacter sp. 15-2]|uniref:DUF4405 domain-containing protein n=1 Tax=Arcobacter sp. 15-2 TaxID=3374109 RepID=UPI00399CC040